MEIIKNKRGIFFTSLVLVILTLFLLTYTFFIDVNERITVQKRIETMNSFLTSLEQDIPRQLRTSGFRIIFLLEKRMIETGVYVDDIDFRFNETFFAGTVYGESNEEIDMVMAGATFSDIESSINEKTSKINAEVTLTNPSISISQEDPWNVKISLDVQFSFKDKSGLASWNRTTPFVAFLPITGFEDPIYPLQTNSPSVVNIINMTPYKSFASASELTDHATNSYYINNTNAPSFLDRLEGTLSASNINGIESLAVPKLNSISGTSIVDYEYFQDTAGQEVSGMPPWFLIDSNANHLDLYQITT